LYEQEKKRLSPADLQLVEAAGKARRIEHRVKKVQISSSISHSIYFILEYRTNANEKTS